jgi:hypothetical protein
MGVYFCAIMDYERARLIFSEMIAHEGFVGRAWLKNAVLVYRTLIDARTMNVEALSGDFDVTNRTTIIPPFGAAEVFLALKRPDEALAYAESVCTATRETGPGGKYIHALLLKTQALAALGKPMDVVSLAETAIPIALGMGYLPVLWRMHALKAQALGQLDAGDMAGKEYGAAAGIIQTLAGSIPDEDSRRTFLVDPLVVEVLAGSNRQEKR